VEDAMTDVRICPRERSGGLMPPEEELLEQTLACADAYVSDDGTITVSRSVVHALAYPGDRFVGRCTVCARDGRVPAGGEPLADVHAAARFVATHDHGCLD
jgi:hypothetical protein